MVLICWFKGIWLIEFTLNKELNSKWLGVRMA